MKIIIKFLLLFWLIQLLSFSQSEANVDSLIVQGKGQLQQAVNKWTDADLLQARAYFERLLGNGQRSWLIRYYIGLADYRLVSYYFSKQNKDQARAFIDDGIDQLQQCVAEQSNFAEARSLLSALYGNKIAVSPFSAMTLGPKSGEEMGKALELEPKNPRTQLIAGWSAYFTPKMFGGGKDKAKIYFEQAIAYFDSFKVSDPLMPDWGRDEAYVWLGIAQMEDQAFEAAKANFDQALAINPENGWVKYALLPDLAKKMAAGK